MGKKVNIDSKDNKYYIEWWDKNILNDLQDNENSFEICKENITIYIEHPSLQIPYSEKMEMLPLKMTKKEIKKIRTQRRLYREKEKQELIRQGFLESPKLRVKISNIIKILGIKSIRNPTHIENEIQDQSKTIKRAHSDRNLASKLSPLEAKEKKDRKKAITTTDIHVAIYRATPLEHPHNKYKIRINALENQLTGLCLTSSKMTIIIVEGCSKSQRRYRKLLTKRIKWSHRKLNGIDVIDENNPGECKQIWNGIVKSAAFDTFMMHCDLLDTNAKKLLTQYGVEHYWDLTSKSF